MLINLICYLIILLISFYFLIKSADFLIYSSSKLGEKIGISKFIIGISLIAIGTSLPELFTSIFAVLDAPKFVDSFLFGTIIGSNIANILLVFSILLIFSKRVSIKLNKFDLLILLISTILLLFLVLNENLTYIISILFLIIFVSYLLISYKLSSKLIMTEINELEEDEYGFGNNILKLIIIFIISIIVLNISAKGVIFGIKNFGLISGIPIKFLTFTTVAFATSLPEIIVTYYSVKKQEHELAIGNIIGSNISNILFILGIIGLIKIISFDMFNYLIILFFLIFVTILFILILLNLNKINKTKSLGFIFLSLYLLYITFFIITNLTIT